MIRVPDKYLALGLFGVLLGLYLWTKDDTVKQMMFGAFTLTTFAISEGLKRISESYRARLERLEAKGGGRRESDRNEES
jgi:hypothetical protein